MEPSTKPTNPKDAVGIGKVPFSPIPGEVLAEIGLGLFEGARKYGRHNFRMPHLGVRASVYYDGTMRHLVDWWEGTDIDPDSGLNHLTKAITSLIVLRDAMIFDNWTDDRPPPPPKGWLTKLNEVAKGILAKYPNPVEAYTHDRVPERSEQTTKGFPEKEPYCEGPSRPEVPSADRYLTFEEAKAAFFGRGA